MHITFEDFHFKNGKISLSKNSSVNCKWSPIAVRKCSFLSLSICWRPSKSCWKKIQVEKHCMILVDKIIYVITKWSHYPWVLQCCFVSEGGGVGLLVRLLGFPHSLHMFYLEGVWDDISIYLYACKFVCKSCITHLFVQCTFL